MEIVMIGFWFVLLALLLAAFFAQKEDGMDEILSKLWANGGSGTIEYKPESRTHEALKRLVELDYIHMTNATTHVFNDKTVAPYRLTRKGERVMSERMANKK